MLYDELFGPWGRILLVGIGAAALLLVLILIACSLTPGCIGYNCLRRRWRRNNETEVVKQFELRNGNSKLGDVSYRSWRLGSLYDNGSICGNGEVFPRDIMGSTHTHWDIENLVHSAKQKDEKKLDSFPTELTLSLQFLPECGEPRNQRGKLIIGIEALSGLPPKQYNCTVEPYVMVQIIKQSWTHRKRELLHSFRTRGIKHTASPIYHETFIIADVNPHEAKGWCLFVTAYDHDRYANHTELCCVKIRMKEVEKIFSSPEIHLFNYRMKPSNQEFGSLLVGICYLPTAQRLTIGVMKLRDLKYPATSDKIVDFSPYVRILMLNGRTGRKMKKKKTRTLQASAQPEFNETLTFDLSFNQLDTVQFLIILCHKIIPEEISTSNQPSDSEDSMNTGKCNDAFIGKVALGKGVRGSIERLHWFSMLQNPRKMVTVWHTLK